MIATALVTNATASARENPPDMLGEAAAQIAGLDRTALEKLMLDMIVGDWRTLRSLRCALGLDWEHDLD